MKRLSLLTIAIALAYFAAGCGIKSKTDDQAIEGIVFSSSWFSSHDVADPGSQALGDTIYPGDLWWREQLSAPSPSLDISVVGDSAYVHFYGQAGGKFHAMAFNPDSGGWADHLKDYTDRFTVEAIFKKIGDPKNDNGWVLWAITDIYAYSDYTPTVKIDSVELTVTGSHNATYKLTDPKQFQEILSTLECAPGDSINTTAYTSGDPASAYLHIIGDNHYERAAMSDQGGGVFTLTRIVPDVDNLHFSVVDLIAEETRITITGNYNVDLWFTPYRVTR